jgi:hypothetical protein
MTIRTIALSLAVLACAGTIAQAAPTPQPAASATHHAKKKKTKAKTKKSKHVSVKSVQPMMQADSIHMQMMTPKPNAT